MIRKTLPVLLLLPLTALSQTQEPEWRVTNPNPARVIPLYTGQGNPFPMREEEAALLEAPANEILNAEETAELQALEAARARAAEAVNASNALQPVLGGLRAEAYISGQKGPMVLINGNWYAVGQTLPVSNHLNPETLDRLEGLADMDADLYAELKGKLEDKLSKNRRGTARIRTIAPEFVTLSTALGEHKIAISQQGW